MGVYASPNPLQRRGLLKIVTKFQRTGDQLSQLILDSVMFDFGMLCVFRTNNKIVPLNWRGPLFSYSQVVCFLEGAHDCYRNFCLIKK